MGHKTVSKTHVAEGSSARVTAVIKDETGAVIAGSALTTLTLTLYDYVVPATIINSRNAQNVLNANGVTVDASGNLTYLMDPADNPINDTTLSKENHVALFQWTWAAGAKAGKHEVIITVENFANVT